MDIKAFDAANAYGAALGRGASSGPSAADSGFGALVETLAQKTGDAVANAERVSAQAVAGTADMVDVVTAISNAEMVMESVTTVRDKVISAYQEIMRMPL